MGNAKSTQENSTPKKGTSHVFFFFFAGLQLFPPIEIYPTHVRVPIFDMGISPSRPMCTQSTISSFMYISSTTCTMCQTDIDKKHPGVPNAGLSDVVFCTWIQVLKQTISTPMLLQHWIVDSRSMGQKKINARTLISHLV